MFAAMTESVWIGGSANSDREWTWADKTTRFLYSNWDEAEPDNDMGFEFCLGIERDNGKWDDKVCLETLPFICSLDKSPEFDTNGVPNPFNCPLDQGYHPLGSSCYKFYSEKKTYLDAQEVCENVAKGFFKYGGLATVWDAHDNSFIYALMNEVQGTEYVSPWIGLYFDKNMYPDESGTKWLWEDRHAITFTNWGSGQPSESNDQTGCGQLKKDGFWTSVKCNEQSTFLCKLEAVYNPDDHGDPGEDLCDPDWIGHGGYCYYRMNSFLGE